MIRVQRKFLLDLGICFMILKVERHYYFVPVSKLKASFKGD